VLLHISGKRQLAQLNSFDLVVLLLLSNVVQNAIIGDDLSLVGGLLGAAVLVAANYFIVRFAFMHPAIGRKLQGRSTTLVAEGRPRAKAMRRELISRQELDVALRRQGLDGGLGSAERVVLEPEGTLAADAKPKPTLADVLAKLERIERRLDARS
jgi:uncharacterized membrane protein YcaP (DUF421 family)